MTVTLGRHGDMTDAGWTSITPSADSKIIYVDPNTGSNAGGNDGTNPGNPLATYMAGRAQLRNGFPDWLLQRKATVTRGDVNSDLWGYWGIGGRSVDEPMVFANYTTEGLVLRTAPRGNMNSNEPNPLFEIWASGLDSNGFVLGSSFQMHDFAMLGIDINGFKNDRANPEFDPAAPIVTGVAMTNCNNILVEDVGCNAASIGFQGVRTDRAVLRRSVVANTYGQIGTFFHLICNMLMEEAYLDHCGFAIADGVPNSFDHNNYGSHTGLTEDPTTEDWTYNSCISVDSANAGLRMRGLGKIFNSIASACGCGIDTGHSGDDVTTLPRDAQIIDNIVLDGLDGTTYGRGGQGGIAVIASLQPYVRKVYLRRNLVANKRSDALDTVGIQISGNTGHEAVNADIDASNKVLNWGGSPYSLHDPIGNTIVNPSTTGGTDNTRTLARYATEVLGLANETALKIAMRANRRYNYNPALHAVNVGNWIRAGAAMPLVNLSGASGPDPMGAGAGAYILGGKSNVLTRSSVPSSPMVHFRRRKLAA